MVWSKAVEDTMGLEDFYEENRANYMWEKRMDATLYTCRDKEVAEFAIKLLSHPRHKRNTPEDIQSKAFAEFADSSSLEFEHRKFEEGDNALADDMNWSKDKVSDIIEEEGKSVFLVNNRILKPVEKKLEECRGIVTADYQNHLEKKWIDTLRAKYPVTVNEALLSRIN
jgi:peptidyl-prolyl cis-trans isomerase SurA